MSLSVLIVAIILLSMCVYVFTKTVSNDAKNDFKLRDILYDSNENNTELYQKKLKENIQYSKDATVEKVYANNIYEELANEQNYQTNKNTYSTTAHDMNEKFSEESSSQYNDDTYYEKINDDPIEEEEQEIETTQKTTYKQPIYSPKKRNLADYVKTFWRGITFSIGALVCVYSFIGLAYNVQTSNDALVYSIWLLIGVILIK